MDSPFQNGTAKIDLCWFLSEHSSTVPLVYDPQTQHISPQYHVIFDAKFTTVPAFTSTEKRDKIFEELFTTSLWEFYVDPADVDASRVTDAWNGDTAAVKKEEVQPASNPNRNPNAKRSVSWKEPVSTTNRDIIDTAPEGAMVSEGDKVS